MALTLLFWITFGAAAVIQLFTSGAKVLENLPPFWFWGIPLAPYTAMYAPWRGTAAVLPGMDAPVPPQPPTPPQDPAPPPPGPAQ